MANASTRTRSRSNAATQQKGRSQRAKSAERQRMSPQQWQEFQAWRRRQGTRDVNLGEIRDFEAEPFVLVEEMSPKEQEQFRQMLHEREHSERNSVVELRIGPLSVSLNIGPFRRATT